jgi:hypothetical protein
MNSFILIFSSLVLVEVNQFAVADPTNSFQWLLSANPAWAALRFFLAAVFVLFALFPSARQRLSVNLMRLLGFSILGMLVGAFIMPDVYPSFGPLDLVTIFEASIVCLLASFEPSWDPVYDYEVPGRRHITALHSAIKRVYDLVPKPHLAPVFFHDSKAKPLKLQTH